MEPNDCFVCGSEKKLRKEEDGKKEAYAYRQVEDKECQRNSMLALETVGNFSKLEYIKEWKTKAATLQGIDDSRRANHVNFWDKKDQREVKRYGDEEDRKEATWDPAFDLLPWEKHISSYHKHQEDEKRDHIAKKVSLIRVHEEGR